MAYDYPPHKNFVERFCHSADRLSWEREQQWHDKWRMGYVSWDTCVSFRDPLIAVLQHHCCPASLPASGVWISRREPLIAMLGKPYRLSTLFSELRHSTRVGCYWRVSCDRGWVCFEPLQRGITVPDPAYCRCIFPGVWQHVVDAGGNSLAAAALCELVALALDDVTHISPGLSVAGLHYCIWGDCPPRVWVGSHPGRLEAALQWLREHGLVGELRERGDAGEALYAAHISEFPMFRLGDSQQ